MAAATPAPPSSQHARRHGRAPGRPRRRNGQGLPGRIAAVLLAAGVAAAIGLPPPSAAAGGLEVSSISDLASGIDDVDDVVIELAQSLEGDGVSIDVDSVSHTSHPSAAGAFRGGEGIIGLDEGVVLSTGFASAVVGPYDRSDDTPENLHQRGDSDLSELVGGAWTFDASVLAFDFTVAPEADEVFLSYVFGSREYHHSVGTESNDVVAIFVNGENCAVIGDPPVKVSINTVNHGRAPVGRAPIDPVNPDLFVNNNPWTPDAEGKTVPEDELANTRMDGFTVPLTCEAPVEPGTNTMRLAIADVDDEYVNSWALIGGGTLSTEPPSDDDADEDDDARVSGKGRVDTAIAVSQEFPDAPAVVLARSDDYPDALAGAPLATTVDGPILLTPSDELDPKVREEIERLGADDVHLLGGTAALSSDVEEELRALGLDTIRYDGESRFATAVQIAEEVSLRGSDASAYVVEGDHEDATRGWPDAVSVSAGAAFAQAPILLTWEDRLPEETALALADDLGVDRAVIVGGEAAVSADVEAEIDGLTPEPVDRVWGEDRYGTSAALTTALMDELGMSAQTTWVATGRSFPDALAAAPLAGSTDPRMASETGVLLLVDGAEGIHGDSPHSRDWLHAHAGEIERVRAVGGDGVITPTTLLEVREAAAVP